MSRIKIHQHLRRLLLLTVLVLCMQPVKAEAAGNEAKTFQFIVDNMNLSPAAACGIMGSIKAESNFTPAIYGMGGAYGLCQWSTLRASRLRSYCSSHSLKSDSLEGQLSFLHYELENTFPQVYAYLKSVSNTATGAYNAGYYFCRHFEAPANLHNASVYRANIAKNTYWPKYGNKAAFLTASASEKGVRLSWSSSSKNKLRIMRGTSKKGTYRSVALLPSSRSSYTDSSVGKDTYYYYISEVSDDGKVISRSNICSVTIRRSLEDEECGVEITGGPYTYTGKKIEPDVQVYYAGNKLKKGTDYTVSYSDNLNAGKAYILLSGKGEYHGSVKKQFQINKAAAVLSVRDVEVTYKKGKTVTPKVKGKGVKKIKYKFRSSDRSVVKGSGKKLKIKGAGITTVTVRTAAGSNYEASDTVFTVTVKPPRPKIRSLKKAAGGLKLKWKKTGGVDGYEIQYTDSGHLTAADPIIDAGKKKSSLLVQLPAHGKWRMRIRGYAILADGSRFYGRWSKAKNGKW